MHGFHLQNTGECQRVRRMNSTLEEIIVNAKPINFTASTPDATLAPFQISEANLKIRICYYEASGKQLDNK